MSYEGSTQTLCQKGHYDIFDAEICISPRGDFKCRDKDCGEPIVWTNEVDQTNGISPQTGVYNGYIDMMLLLVSPAAYCTCRCGDKHQLRSPIFRVPDSPEELEELRIKSYKIVPAKKALKRKVLT